MDWDIKELRQMGWVFYYDSGTRVVGAYHPKQGKVNLIEIIPRSILVNCDDLAGMLVGSLNQNQDK